MAAEFLQLASEVPGRYRTLVLVGGVLGLRWGEAIGLRVRDIFFLHRSVTVTETVDEVAGTSLWWPRRSPRPGCGR